MERSSVADDDSDAHSPDSPVSVRMQVEGELLSMSQEELKEKVDEGREFATMVLEKMGIPPSDWGLDLLNRWIEIDPNMLDRVSVAQPDIAKGTSYFVSHLWGMVGPASIKYESKRGEGSTTHSNVQQMNIHPALRRALRERILFDKLTPRQEEELEHLRAAALAGALEDDFEQGMKWVEEYKNRNKMEVVREAWSKHISVQKDEKRKAAIRKLLHWDHSFDHGEEALRWANEPSADKILEDMEKREQDAKVYQKKWAERRERLERARRNDDDEAAIEREYDGLRAVNHPVRDLLHKSPFLGKATSETRHWTPAIAIAVTRFIRQHPDCVIEHTPVYGKKDPDEDDGWGEEEQIGTKESSNLPHHLNAVLTVLEGVPKEDIPADVLAFLKRQLSDPAVAGNEYITHSWPYLADASKNAGQLDRYFAGKQEINAVKKALERARSAVDLPSDPRLIHVIADWLSKGRPSDIATKEKFSSLESALTKAAASYMGEPELQDDPYDVYLATFEPKKFQGPIRKTIKSGYDASAWHTAFALCQKNLRLEDACALLKEHEGMTWASGVYSWERAYDMPKEVMEAHAEARENPWIMWDIVRADGAEALGRYLLTHHAQLRRAFQKDVPRATDAIRTDILLPLMEEEKPQLQILMQTLDVLAQYDAGEAKALLSQMASSERLWNDEYALNRQEVQQALLRICYGDICYEAPEKRNYLEAMEKEGSTLPPAVALALHWEAKGGTPWAPRIVPPLNTKALEETWMRLVRDQEYPQRSNGGGNERSSGRNPFKDMRDALLENRNGSGESNPDEPAMPAAPSLSKNPKVVATLSEPLTGDSSYLLTKICDDFDMQWLAHMPTEVDANMALRDILQRPVSEGKRVTCSIRMGHGAAVPLPLASSVDSVETSAGRGLWAEYWTRRMEPKLTANGTIPYVAGEDRAPAECDLDELRAKLPEAILRHQDALASAQHLPQRLQDMLAQIDTKNLSLAQIVKRAQGIVQEHYEYCFLNEHPTYREAYTKLLTNMPYQSDRNEYLDFIHSLRTEDEDVMGRGVCGQLSTVLQASLRSLGVPAYFATGYAVSGTTVTTNDAHAWVLVPMLDADGNVIMKPVEATDGGLGGLEEVRSNAPKIDEVGEEATPEKKAEASEDESGKLLRGEVERWRSRMAALLGIGELSATDVERAAGFVQEAVQRTGKTPGTNLNDLLDPMGYAMTPAIRGEIERGAQTMEMTDGTRKLVDYLLERSGQEYAEMERKWQEGQQP